MSREIHKLNIKLILAVLLLFIGVDLVVILWSKAVRKPPSDSLTQVNYKDYVNTEQGLHLRIPQTWPSPQVTHSPDTTEIRFADDFVIVTELNSSSESGEFINFTEYLISETGQNSKPVPVQIGNVAGFLITKESQDGIKEYRYIVAHPDANDMHFVIAYQVSAGDEMRRKDFEQVIETLQYIGSDEAYLKQETGGATGHIRFGPRRTGQGTIQLGANTPNANLIYEVVLEENPNGYAKSRLVNLKDFVGQRIELTYREVYNSNTLGKLLYLIDTVKAK